MSVKAIIIIYSAAICYTSRLEIYWGRIPLILQYRQQPEKQVEVCLADP